MAKVKEFETGLQALFRQRTAKLRRRVGVKRRGPVPKLTKAKIQKAVTRLVGVAREILVRDLGRSEFKDCYSERRRWHPKQGKGHGVDAKRAAFKLWLDENIDSPNCVYLFWTQKKAEYVGRTGKGGSRPQSHFQKYWFPKVTRIDIYVIRTRRVVAKSECLAIDLFKPRRNKMKSSRPKYRAKCPVCSAEREIKKQLKYLFRIR